MSIRGNRISVRWNEDGSADVYARLIASDASGAAVPGEGRAIRPGDLTSLTFRTYDEADPATAVNTGTLTPAAVISSTLQTKNDDPAWPYARGFNFHHVLGPENFPTGNHTYTVEYKFTTSGGSVGFAKFTGLADPSHSG